MTPPSVSEKAREATVEATVPLGPESIAGTGGATVSAVQVREVVADVLSTESFARTWNVCDPWPRLV